MKIACGLKEGALFMDADLCVHKKETGTVSNKEIIADMKKMSEQEGAISYNYNEKTDTIEVRFEELGKILKFFECLA